MSGVTIGLAKVIQAHDKDLSELVMREPSVKDTMELGQRHGIWHRRAGRQWRCWRRTQCTDCPGPRPIPASLQQAGERLKTQEDYSLRAQRNIRAWREKLNTTPSTSAQE